MTNSKLIDTIITYEHDNLICCENKSCMDCFQIFEEDFCCENKCSKNYFEELKNYCSKDNADLGFEYLSSKKCISFNKHTGIIQFSDGTYLEILPKISKNNTIEESHKIFENLINASHNLTKEYKANRETGINTNKNKHIIEIFISVFCNDLKEILKRGIKKSYIKKEENLNVYRGKINFSKQIKYNSASRHKFYVEYSEFNINNSENRILKSACLYLIKETNEEQNKKVLRQMLIELDDVDVCMNIEKDVQDLQINRLHQYYERPIKYAEFFLRKKSFMPKRGSNKLPSLLFPLNEMFEDYIENILLDNKINVKTQLSKFSLLKNRFNTRMDYVIFNEDSIFILDAKWKLLDKSQDNFGVAQSDLYQLFAYSKILLEQEEHKNKNIKIALLYPKTENFNEQVDWEYFNGTPIPLIPIDVLNPDNNNYITDYLR